MVFCCFGCVLQKVSGCWFLACDNAFAKVSRHTACLFHQQSPILYRGRRQGRQPLNKTDAFGKQQHPKQKGFSSLVLPKLALDHMSSHIGLAPALVSILLDWAKSKLGRATGAAEKHSNLASCRDRFGATLISD